jgi:L-seryl-tRNA(Ser) seleniumtransferase
MYRALRVDKLIIEALETTLRHLLVQDWQAVPTMRMIMTPESVVRDRAERVAAQMDGIECLVRAGNSPIGGGSTPDQTLPSWVVELQVTDPAQLEQKLRRLPVPVIARIEKERVILDMRTVFDEEVTVLGAGVVEASR